MPHDMGATAPGPYGDFARSLASLDQAILDALPMGFMACDASGAILRFNHRAAQIWGRRPEAGEDLDRFVAGLNFFKPDGAPLRAHQTPLAMALQDAACFHKVETVVVNPDGRRWCCQSTITPLLDEAGRVTGVINCFQDVTREKADRKAREITEVQHGLVMSGLPIAVYTTDAEGRITFYNDAAAELAGREPQIGSDRWCVSWKLYGPQGEPMSHGECPLAIALREDRPVLGEIEAIVEQPHGGRTPILPFASPLYDSSGKVCGAVSMLVDISERKRADERQRVLIDELNHRVKNTLATVQSIAMQTLTEADSLESFKRGYEGRLVALARAHDLLTSTAWRSAELTAILAQELDAFGRGRFSLTGPRLELSPRAGVTLGMIVHELATNAAKHGALSGSDGRVEVMWTADDSEIRIHWRERGGPAARAPTRRGFGARLLERAVARDLGGDVATNYNEEGLRCLITLPAPGNLA